MKLTDLNNLLMTVGVPVYHYEAHKEKGSYIVWAEDGQAGSLYADDRKTEQILQGTIDYFTRIEFDPIFDLIQEKLNAADITWSLNSIQYEVDTRYIHYEWVWEVENDIG